MDLQTDILTPFEKIQKSISVLDEKAYLNIFTFNKQHKIDNLFDKNGCYIAYYYSITPIRSCLLMKLSNIYDKYKYQLDFVSNSYFTQRINCGDIIGIIPQQSRKLEVIIDKITIICSEIRISKKEMYFINPHILTGKDEISWINPESPNGYFSLSTEQVRSFIESPYDRVIRQMQLYKDSGTNDVSLSVKRKELEKEVIEKHYYSNLSLQKKVIKISNMLFPEPFITNNLNKENVKTFIERNKKKKIIDLMVEFGIDKSTISYSIEGKTYIEEESSVNYYWDEEQKNIYSTKVSFNDNQTFIDHITNLIAKNDMAIVGDRFLSIQGNYQLIMAIPEDDELKKYGNLPIREEGYPRNTPPDEIILENRIKYISTIIGGCCVHSRKRSIIDGSKHSL